uniref:Nudix hydrolase domain-containing protein n=1 Tax=Glossina austeni TaxID=7395 RepID=A0A1A9V1K4_GLOAU
MAKEIAVPDLPMWRDSASLIICVKATDELPACNYKLLMLKRSDRTSLIDDQTVFPGGLYDDSDEAIEWLKYFEKFGVTEQMLDKSLGGRCYDQLYNSTNAMPREISLRINALRETFEEVGVFICRNRKQLLMIKQRSFCKPAYDYEQSYWQQIVHNDPRQFLRMCRELKVVPDLWSLYKWSCWASPAVLRKGYETTFFVSFLQETPMLLPEKTEVKECLWSSPMQYLQMNRDKKIHLSSPQFYEITRFTCNGSFDKLQKFAQERDKCEVAFYLPILYLCDDGIVSVLPGDDFYIGNPRTSLELRHTNCTIEQFQSKSKRIHRIETIGSPSVAVCLNFQPLPDHLLPICEGEVDNKAKL